MWTVQKDFARAQCFTWNCFIHIYTSHKQSLIYHHLFLFLYRFDFQTKNNFFFIFKQKYFVWSVCAVLIQMKEQKRERETSKKFSDRWYIFSIIIYFNSLFLYRNWLCATRVGEYRYGEQSRDWINIYHKCIVRSNICR